MGNYDDLSILDRLQVEYRLRHRFA